MEISNHSYLFTQFLPYFHGVEITVVKEKSSSFPNAF